MADKSARRYEERRHTVGIGKSSTLPPSSVQILLTRGYSSKAGLRPQLYQMLERPRSSRLAMSVLVVLFVCIFASIAVYFASSLQDGLSPTLKSLEIVCTIVFTMELFLRLYVGTMNPWVLLVRDATFWIDAASIVPFYAEVSIGLEGFANLPIQLKTLMQLMQLLRLLRVLKLMRHYTGWRVLTLAVERSWRAICVPVFAMLIAILVLSGLLHSVESLVIISATESGDEELADAALPDAFASMWVVFWIVTTLGFEGSFGSEHPAARLIIAAAVLVGLLLTTMPITVIGNAFSSAWEQKEVVEVAMRVQELLAERGLSRNDLRLVFAAFDSNSDQSLDWAEFKEAMRVLQVNFPLFKMRALFALFDADDSGAIDSEEFCRLLCPSVASDSEAPHETDGGFSATRAKPPEGRVAPAPLVESLADHADGGASAVAGTAPFHELHRNPPPQQHLFQPRLVHPEDSPSPTDPAAPAEQDGAGRRLVEAARRAATRHRALKGQAAPPSHVTVQPTPQSPGRESAQNASRSPRPTDVSHRLGELEASMQRQLGSSSGQLDDVSRRIGELEASMQRVLSLLEASRKERVDRLLDACAD